MYYNKTIFYNDYKNYIDNLASNGFLNLPNNYNILEEIMTEIMTFKNTNQYNINLQDLNFSLTNFSENAQIFLLKNARIIDYKKLDINLLPKTLNEVTICTFTNYDLTKLPKMPKLIKLALNNNNLTEFNGDYPKLNELYSDYPELIQLNISYNNLIEFNANCPKLTTLIINNNKLTKFNTDCPKLTSLDISHNNLIEFNTSYPKLHELDISNNKLTEFNTSYPKLQELDISSNKLTEFNITYPKLTSLDISYNILTEFNTDYFELFHLNVSNNNLTEFNGNYPKLRFFNIDNNKLTKFNSYYPELNKLGISNNNLTEFNADYFKLNKLDISNNKLTEFNGDYFELNKLDISNNKLTEFDGRYYKITKLNISNNKLIEFITNTSTINILNISNNNLTEFNGNWHKLIELDISNNKLTEFNADCPNLKNLNISNNKLTKFNADCPNLKNLNISNNIMLTKLPKIYYKIARNLSMQYKNNNFKLDTDIFEQFPELKKFSNNLQFKKYGKAPYFGCELEISFKNNEDKEKCLNELWKNKHGFHLSYDESVTNGFEIITDILSFEYCVLLFKKIFKILQKYNAKCDSSCGFHIHIDKNNDIKNKIDQIFHPGNQDKLELIGLRSLNEYCKIKIPRVNRYEAINMFNEKTYELRFFRCTLILKNVIRFLVFTNDLIKMDIHKIIKKYDLKIKFN